MHKKYFKNKIQVDVYKEALMSIRRPWRKCRFQIMKDLRFDNSEVAYSDFISKKENVISVVAFIKAVRMKTNTSEWFDRKIAEKIHTWDGLYKKLDFTKLHANDSIYK